jgi:phosphoglycolate phosphatase
LIVLFDLDGTVLTFRDAPPGPGRSSMDAAMKELFGLERASEGVLFAGGTDKAIARALLAKTTLPVDRHDDHIDLVLDAYLRALDRELSRRRYVPVGDVAGAVAACTELGMCVGLATGNVREGARKKLASAGLAATFDLAKGGYGCDGEHRPDVLRAAVARCAPHAKAGARVVVVGDTRHDVSAARAIGAKVVGVAVSKAAREELAQAGADAIVDDCGADMVRAISANGA